LTGNRLLATATLLDVNIAHVRGHAEVMLFGVLCEQKKTLPKGSSTYLLASVGAGASR